MDFEGCKMKIVWALLAVLLLAGCTVDAGGSVGHHHDGGHHDRY